MGEVVSKNVKEGLVLEGPMAETFDEARKYNKAKKKILSDFDD